MARYSLWVPILAGLALVSCSSSPDEPINQTAPIRTMDNFFRSVSPSTSARPPGYARAYTADPGYAPAYTHEPGYAPAYPPLEPSP